MNKADPPKFVCLCCGQSSVNGPNLCSVNLHNFEALTENSKRNGYTGSFQSGAIHLKCIEPYFLKAEDAPECCMICERLIDATSEPALKLAVYVYRRRGCSAVLSVHDRCFANFKIKEFFLIRPSVGRINQ
jgi:hypothetical protein